MSNDTTIGFRDPASADELATLLRERRRGIIWRAAEVHLEASWR